MSNYKFSGPYRTELARAADRAVHLLGSMESKLGDLPYDRVKPMFDEINKVRDHLNREVRAWAEERTSVAYYVSESEPATENEPA